MEDYSEDSFENDYTTTFDSYDFDLNDYNYEESNEIVGEDNDILLDDEEVLSNFFSSFFAGLGILLLILVAIFFVLGLLTIIANWKIYKKAGEKGWKSIIPIYGGWVQFEFLNMPGWLSLVSLIPFIGQIAYVIFHIIACVRLSKAFGKDPAFSIGLIFLPIIFYPIIGFGNCTYLGKEAAGNRLFG